MDPSLQSALSYPFRWLFEIPPIERRPSRNVFTRTLGFGNYDPAIRETYIYYKVFFLSLWFNTIFMGLFLLSFVLETDIRIGPFGVDYRPQAPVDALVYDYPLRFFPVLAVITVVYSLGLYVFKTDVLSKQRIRTEHTPRMRWMAKDFYTVKPLRVFWIFAFFLVGGHFMFGAPEILREYWIYNKYLHNFREHTLQNWMIFAVIYLGFYQWFFSQLAAFAPAYLARSILRHYVYRKELDI